ncbi:hypothetical protein FQA39_LY10110 [Lamprigera yunnana]|nr:hypothetical protein FQA39_LY10110 [Lamprigera yunnana]
MNCSEKKVRKKNPRESASWASVLTFFFTLKLFKKSFRGNIDENDVYETMPSLSSETLGNEFEKEWKKEKNKFIKPLVKIFWKRCFYWALSISIVETSVMIVYPLLLGKLVAYFTPGQTEVTLNKAVICTFELVVLILVYTFFIQSYLLYIMELGLKIRVACCSLIYRKYLRINTTLMDKNVNGLILTIISKDINQIESTVDVIIFNISGLCQVVVMIYMMYIEIGLASLVGSSLLIIMIPIQGKVLIFFHFLPLH